MGKLVGMKKLVACEIVMILLTVGTFFIMRGLGASDGVVAFATGAVVLAAFAAAVAFAFAAAFVVAFVAAVAFAAVAAAFVVVLAAAVAAVAFAFAFAEELHLNYRWVLLTLLIEAAAIFSGITLGLTVGGFLAPVVGILFLVILAMKVPQLVEQAQLVEQDVREAKRAALDKMITALEADLEKLRKKRAALTDPAPPTVPAVRSPGTAT